jgi:hypothetical protein
MRSVTSQGHAYAQFKRALRAGHIMMAWGLAAELPNVPLADALELLLLARDLEPARFDRTRRPLAGRHRRFGMRGSAA